MARNFTGQKQKKPGGMLRQILATVGVFALVAGLFLWGMQSVDATTKEEQLKVVERAVTKAVIQCYALEGQYPASVAYLRDNYGLSVDEEKYMVVIEFVGGNMMPRIDVRDRASLQTTESAITFQ